MQAGSDPDVKNLFKPTLKIMDMGDGYFIAPSAKKAGCFDICSLAEYFGDLAKETAATVKARKTEPLQWRAEGGRGLRGCGCTRVHAGACTAFLLVGAGVGACGCGVHVGVCGCMHGCGCGCGCG